MIFNANFRLRTDRTLQYSDSGSVQCKFTVPRTYAAKSFMQRVIIVIFVRKWYNGQCRQE